MGLRPKMNKINRSMHLLPDLYAHQILMQLIIQTNCLVQEDPTTWKELKACLMLNQTLAFACRCIDQIIEQETKDLTSKPTHENNSLASSANLTITCEGILFCHRKDLD